jgi:hypothetical protein
LKLFFFKQHFLKKFGFSKWVKIHYINILEKEPHKNSSYFTKPPNPNGGFASTTDCKLNKPNPLEVKTLEENTASVSTFCEWDSKLSTYHTTQRFEPKKTHNTYQTVVKDLFLNKALNYYEFNLKQK